MKFLFHLGHPAHFHLFKNVIQKLKNGNNDVHILIKEKDVLKSLLEEAEHSYENILPEGKSVGKLGLVTDLFKRGNRIYRYSKQVKPDILIGTSVDISYIGKLLNIPSINVNEDDAEVVPLYSWLAYPLATKIISPTSCNNSRWQNKTTTYPGYHELAYLHPDHFSPSQEIVNQYIDSQRKFFIIRFAGLSAHHDDGVRGINDELAINLVQILSEHGKILITSERKLIPSLEEYRISINPADMHHLLAYASLVVGDSQTMSAESGVLGTPYIRYNDFVGKIGYLRELEEKYKLGFGISPDKPNKLLDKAIEIAKSTDKRIFKNRRKEMLSEKINVADFLHKQIIEIVEN